MKGGVFLHQVRDGGPEVQRTERHRRVDAQHAARLGLQPRHRTIGFFQVGEDGDAALVIRLPVLGRAGAARGADEQLHPEVSFEIDHVFAYGRARQAQLPRRSGKAAVLHHSREGLDAGQLVHSASRRGSAIVLKSST